MLSINRYFPYRGFRRGQLEAIQFIREVLIENAIGLLHAPTGIGKTIAALVSYLSLDDERDGSKLVILTRTKSQTFMYIKEIERIKRKSGADISYTTFRSKKDMCLLALSSDKLRNLPYHVFLKTCESLKKNNRCPFFKRSYNYGIPSDRLIKASLEVKAIGASYFRIIKIAKKYGVCPYEISRYLAPQVEVVIGSYSYIFNPDIREKFLSNINESLRSIYLIVDEAHNLPDYILSALSLSLSTQTIEAAKKEISLADYDYAEYLYDLLDNLLEKIKGIGNRVLSKGERGLKIIDPKEISSMYSRRDYLNLRELGEKVLEAGEFSTRLLWLSDYLEYFKLLSDLKQFVTVIERLPVDSKRAKHFAVTLQLLDPSDEAKNIFKEIKSAILMSGSLYPLDYFEKILGLRDEESIRNRIRELIIPFPFSPNSLLILVDRACTTKYDLRTSSMYDRIARRLETISTSISSQKAILVVFPSYEILKEIAFRTRIKDRRIIVETPKTEIERVLTELSNNPRSIIFSVAGGKLMEGIDYRVDDKTLLSAVVLVGLPFPEWNDVVRAQEKYFANKFGAEEGRFLTIIAPAIRKAVQAGGRLIRDERDRGLIIILDKRYRDFGYWKYFPPWWRKFRSYLNSDELSEIIREFNFM